MAFKVVGVDENSLFPQRVEDRLNGKFATPGDIDDLSTIYAGKSVETTIETGRLSAANVDTKIANEIGADKLGFEIAKAQLTLATRLDSPPDENRVMQSVASNSKLDGDIFYSMAYAVGEEETTRVIRCSSGGRFIEQIILNGAGHGTGVFIEVDSGGNIWLWTSYINGASSDPAVRYNYVRMPWQTGTFNWEQVSQYRLPAISGQYLTAHYDELTGIVGIRNDFGDGSGATFTTHNIYDIVSGVWDELSEMTYTYPSDCYPQGWAHLNDVWYIYSGSSEELVPYYAAKVFAVSDTGTLLYTRNVDRIRLGSAGKKLSNFSEPEGIAVVRSAKGEPSLMLGVSVGPTTARSGVVFTLNMGVSPFPATTYDPEYGKNSFRAAPVSSYVNGFESATGNDTFGVRRVGDYVEFIGRLVGTITPGATTQMLTLRTGYRTSAVRRAIVSKNTGSSNPAGYVRVELNSNGSLSVVSPSTDTGASSWLDMTGVRMYVGDVE